ncbi:hypothetical protein [Oceanospirillum beijerinckii]|uniref:hypothetical protein n=1 Tax=Oceanospirillum beijerinckii TaxID=64976 RepID=UPI000408E001|nr:hypothetical protein [Oceanospirillum beijerinckii]
MTKEHANQDVLTELQNQASAMQSQYGKERDVVNQLLGQAQMADSIAKFTSTVAISKMAFVKENKLYKGLHGMKGLDGRDLSGTWEEFCKLLGTSAAKVNEDIHNLQSFGEEALESMGRMGIGYREMRQYRRLPEDQKAALLEVAKDGDKESFVELAEEVISKHTKEKEQLTKDLEESRADYDALDAVNNTNSMKLEETKLELERTKQRIKKMKPDEAIKEIRQEVSSAAYEAEVSVMSGLRKSFEALSEQSDVSETDERAFMSGLLDTLEKEIIALREDFSLPSLGAGDINWMNPDALAEAEARLGVGQGTSGSDSFEDKEPSDESRDS